MKPTILVIKEKAENFVSQLTARFGTLAHIRSSPDGLSGLCDYQIWDPVLVLIDQDLHDISGMSVATILKDIESGPNSLIYLMGIMGVLENTKADRYISKTYPLSLLYAQIATDLHALIQQGASDSMLNAIEMQNDMLPKRIETNEFMAQAVFSAYDHLSGDCINYWYNEKKDEANCLFGFLFDCEGHSLSSYGQVGSAFISMKKGMRLYQVGAHKTLSNVMEDINTDYVTLYDHTVLVPSLCFCFDFSAQVLHYCPAGIPHIIIKRKGSRQREMLMLQSSLLGYAVESTFEENVLPLVGLEEIIFTTDGLTDLMIDQQEDESFLDCAKHDDVSAIYVRLK